ncbi:NepR family anti-sigma factor [Altererythrobacter fulvus]|uniref:NepR family anti-sigma factor n=1 Tax=Caenibius fulvus TaxID=2126012 RepID=UPI0030163143
MSERSDNPGKADAKPASAKQGKTRTARAGARAAAQAKGKPPEWADGLKRLYDSVVEEPLPDAFKDLLSRLDDDQS